MAYPSLDQLLAALEKDGVTVERPREPWLQVFVEGPDPRLGGSFLLRYSSGKGDLRVWTGLQPASEHTKTSPDLCLAMLCLNRKLHGAIIATEDGSLQYKSPRWILAEPNDYRGLFALAMTEAGTVREVLQQIKESGEDPLSAVRRSPAGTEQLDFLR